MPEQFPAIGGVEDAAQVRVMLMQSGKQVHAPASGLGKVLLGLNDTTGIVVQTGINAFTKRTLTAGAGLSIADGDGVAGNPTITLAAGAIVDSAFGSYATNAAITTVIPSDDTIPQVGEGTEILSVVITPKSTSNKLRVRFQGTGAANGAIGIIAAVFVNGGTNAIAATDVSADTANFMRIVAIEHEFTPGAVSAQTISVRVGPGSAGTIRFNGTSAARFMGGVMHTTLVVEEIKA